MLKPHFGNGILDSLPRGEREAILPELKSVTFKTGEVLYRPDERISSAYFPSACVISIINVMRDGNGVEIVTIGHEGLVGTPVIWGADRTPHQTVCQLGGEAYSIRMGTLQALVPKARTLRLLMQRHAQAVYISMGQSIACNSLHSLTQRCARWLLLTHDRVGSDRFPLTQEFLASMLGVNRQSVSVVASTLQKFGFIKYSRGYLTIVDRKGLKSNACECYQLVADQYKRLLSNPRR